MRKTLSSTGALVAAACALAILPAGGAHAGDGPPPQTREAAASSTAPTPEGNPNSRNAQAAGVCNDAYQIGKTGYIKRGGKTIGSVKQFYSRNCQRNYGYLWIWDQHHGSHPKNDVSIGVWDFTTNKQVGIRSWQNTNQQEFWSSPTATVRHCTAARGGIRPPMDAKQSYAYSQKRCYSRA